MGRGGVVVSVGEGRGGGQCMGGEGWWSVYGTVWSV